MRGGWRAGGSLAFVVEGGKVGMCVDGLGGRGSRDGAETLNTLMSSLLIFSILRTYGNLILCQFYPVRISRTEG